MTAFAARRKIKRKKKNMKINRGNDSAYPIEVLDGDGVRVWKGGMTIRAQMAAMICAGYISSLGSVSDSSHECYARAAVKQADALIAELNKEPNA